MKALAFLVATEFAVGAAVYLYAYGVWLARLVGVR